MATLAGNKILIFFKVISVTNFKVLREKMAPVCMCTVLPTEDTQYKLVK